jgi:chromosome segregation ATPase
MQKTLTSECDSLRQALELAQKEVAKAQKAQKEAEGRVASIEAQIRAQDAQLESARRHLEKRGGGAGSPGNEKEERIKSLETLCEQKKEENRQLRTRLLESAAKRAASERIRWRG